MTDLSHLIVDILYTPGNDKALITVEGPLPQLEPEKYREKNLTTPVPIKFFEGISPLEFEGPYKLEADDKNNKTYIVISDSIKISFIMLSELKSIFEIE